MVDTEGGVGSLAMDGLKEHVTATRKYPYPQNGLSVAQPSPYPPAPANPPLSVGDLNGVLGQIYDELLGVDQTARMMASRLGADMVPAVGGAVEADTGLVDSLHHTAVTVKSLATTIRQQLSAVSLRIG